MAASEQVRGARSGILVTPDVPVIDQSNAGRFFWTNSRSFSFAAMGFRRDERRLVELVYAFCRISDDLVDEAGSKTASEVISEVDDWLQLSRRAYEGENTDLEWLNDLMSESARRDVPFAVIETLVEGVKRDATLVEIETVADLREYCYGVASIVGVWLCYLFGVSDQWFLERAEALGRGMQLTNILRDVGEDLRRDRVYLPAEMMSRHGLRRADLEAAMQSGVIPQNYPGLLDEVIDLAEEDYRMAWEAIPHLPSSFSRASAIAAEVYRAIHVNVVSNGYDNLTRRSRTGTITKTKLMIRAMTRLAFAGRKSKPKGSFT